MAAESPLDATGIARRQFSTSRRGYDQGEVRAFLHELSEVVGRLQRGQAHEHDRAERAEARAKLAERLDEHRLVELLGEETARVLDAARAAAGEIRSKAEESAARLVREAQGEARTFVAQAEKAAAARRVEILAEADELRREAEEEVERRRMEGQVVVDEMRREAEEEREHMLAEGERARSEAEAVAEQIRASAREQGRRLVGEAQTVRERMLTDLARRRRTAREQLERLNGARERLLAAYEVVKRTVDEATTELTVALPEARQASEQAMRRVSDEPAESIEVLEAELSVARLSGLSDVATSEVTDDELDGMLRELAEEEAAAAQALGDIDDGGEDEPDDDAAGPGGDDALRPSARDAEVPAPAKAGSHDAPPRPDEPTDAGAPPGESRTAESPPSQAQPVQAGMGDAPPAAGVPEGTRQPPREMTDGEKWGIRLPRARRAAPPQPADAGRSQAADRTTAGPAAPVAPTSHVGPTSPARPKAAAVAVEVPTPAAPDPGPTVATAEIAETDDEGESGPYVDELFARIRAERDTSPAPAETMGAPSRAAAPDHADTATDPDTSGDDAHVDPATRALRGRDAALAGAERDLGRKLKRVLADEQNQVLDTLRRGGTVEFQEVLPEADEHADRFAIAATADLDAAAVHGAALSGGEKAGSCDELAGALGLALVEPLRARVARSFDECDGDLEEVSERLRALYREWKGQHIGAAVRHYTAAAYAAGAYGAAGDGVPLRWLVDQSCDACPDCDDNALAGEVAKGEAFPTGDACAPAHADCRCLVVPAALLDPG